MFNLNMFINEFDETLYPEEYGIASDLIHSIFNSYYVKHKLSTKNIRITKFRDSFVAHMELIYHTNDELRDKKLERKVEIVFTFRYKDDFNIKDAFQLYKLNGNNLIYLFDSIDITLDDISMAGGKYFELIQFKKSNIEKYFLKDIIKQYEKVYNRCCSTGYLAREKR